MNAKLKFWWLYPNPISGNQFSIGRWIIEETFRKLRDAFTVSQPMDLPDRLRIFKEYSIELEKQELHREKVALVEEMIASDVTEALRECGVRPFPPPVFRVVNPPNILVISHRNQIRQTAISGTVLRPHLSENQIEEIEKFISQADPQLCGMVTNLGGLALFPPILNLYHPPTLMNVAGHEWCHIYLFFSPLGFGNQVLKRGLSVIEENVCNIVGREIFETIAKNYGWQKLGESKSVSGEYPPNLILRELRQRVDQLLKDGRIEEAETAMEEGRQSLNRLYGREWIRKLNQAYFAFHGNYGGPESGKDPTRDYLLAIRRRSANLREFLRKVRRIKEYEDLVRLAQTAS